MAYFGQYSALRSRLWCRYACGLVRLSGEPPWLGVLLLVAGYLAPWTTLAVGLSLAARRAALQRWRRRQLELAARQQGRGVSSPSALTFSLVDTPLGHLSLEEYRSLVLSTALFCMYLAMLVPGILSSQVSVMDVILNLAKRCFDVKATVLLNGVR